MYELMTTIRPKKGVPLMRPAYTLIRGLEEFTAAREQFAALVNQLQYESGIADGTWRSGRSDYA